LKANASDLTNTNSNLANKANSADVTTAMSQKLNKDSTQIDWLDRIRRSGLYTLANKAYTPDNTQDFIFQAITHNEGGWIIWLIAYQQYADHVYLARMSTTNGTTYTVGTWHLLF